VRNITFILLLGTLMPLTPVLGDAQPTGSKPVSASIAASVTRLPVRTDSRLWLEGSSNVRDWTCRATSMDATIDLNAAAGTRGSLDPSAVRGVRVRVPVRMLKCGDRHMEAEMYTALKSPKPPAESFITATLEQLPVASTVAGTVEVQGQLTIAGVERTVTMTVTSDKLPDGTHRARGTVPILMTDFGIKPPRPWGGILKTKNKVLIQFEIFVAPIS
jgi:polyisoprenoid-binding protein YceI